MGSTINVPVYLNDDEMANFLKNKKKILAKAREFVKKEVE